MPPTVTQRAPRLGILATHPIQYYVPWYRALDRAVDLRVFYCQRQTPEGQAAAGFGVPFAWDIPLLEGYRHRFLTNQAREPDVSSFFGCDTPEVSQIICQQRFDAFIVQGWATKSFWQAMMACWRSGTPLLVRGDSQLASSRHAIWQVAKYLPYRLFIPRFDAYLIVGERAREYLLHYGASPRRMFFAPHAVDNEFFSRQADPLRRERERLRAAWGIPADAVVFLFAGKFIPKKRPADFVRAVAGASRRESRVWGLLAGDGPLRASLESLARDRGWPLSFVGFLNQTEMPQAYAASDALVLPSDGRETWGLVVNEAMASGLAVIVSDQVGCAPDLVLSGSTGETFRCGEVEELASIMSRLAGDRSSLATLGRNGRRHVQRYSVARAAEGTLAAVHSLPRRRATDLSAGASARNQVVGTSQ